MKQFFRMATPIIRDYCRFGHRLLTLALLLVAMMSIPMAWVPCQAQNPQVGVILPETQLTLPESLHQARDKDSLLLLLKQVFGDFSTIQLKELSTYKGTMLFVPMMDESAIPVLKALQTQPLPQTTQVFILPMLSESTPQLTEALESMGFHIHGMTYSHHGLYLSSQLAMKHIYLPIGSPILLAESDQKPLATWGSHVPALVQSGNVFLFNWNWGRRLSPVAMKSLLSQVVPQELFATTLTQQAVITQPEPPLSVKSVKSEPKPQPAQQAPVKMATQPPQQVMFSPPNPSPSVKSQTIAPPSKDQDSTPSELYDFDGLSTEALHKRRNVETQYAMASFYNDRMRELADLEDNIRQMIQANTANPSQQQALQNALNQANDTKSHFETAWFQQNYGPALADFEQSKGILTKSLFNFVPDAQIEGRAIWLDRGSIVKAGNPQNLRRLIQHIAAAGFNIIYFETVNAGYPIYPSHLIDQNPQVNGWDPLAIAVDEAHKDGMELHAWVWTFAVGNTRHNKILGQPMSFPGPILSKPEMASEALLGRHGEMVLPEQYEYWLSPASFKARAFLTSLFSEIVQNYKVDGLQLDYIRYPFQKPLTPMGLEDFAVNRFRSETGLDLSQPSDFTTKAWDAWKAFQVTTFVRDLSMHLKSINPQLKLSAAVFPLTRNGRMRMIQQDWETWVKYGWIDTLSPMAYSKSPRSLRRLVNYIDNISGNKILVYPGLSLRKLNPIELLDTLEICRQTGVMGTTLFAFTQLDRDKQLLLETGPYKLRKAIPPHRSPIYASQELVKTAQDVTASIQQSTLNPVSHQQLQSIHDVLSRIAQRLGVLKQSQDEFQINSTLSSLKDESRVLSNQMDRLKTLEHSNVLSLQIRVLKESLAKVVRMVDYTTFQVASIHQYRQVGSVANIH